MSLEKIISSLSNELVRRSEQIRDLESRMQRMYQLAADLVWPDADTKRIMDEFDELMPERLVGKYFPV